MKKALWILPAFSVLALFVISLSAEPTAIGPEECAKICHKIQYQSWLKTKHAAGGSKVDCESCHGNGSAYARMHIMKDPSAWKDAGLVPKPGKESCTAKCHRSRFTEDMLKAVHDHKK